jgi:N-methylhydantoinase B
MDAINLSIFANRLDAVCSEMGATLQKSAFSPNIRDRLDYSCAIFDAKGALCAQAAHIPVHLGSMAFAMADVVSVFDWRAGDMMVLNDPFKGGTHLPDVTLIAPLFIESSLIGFVVNRAHHADIGSETPGSMPLSSSLLEEGKIIEPALIVKHGEIVKRYFDDLMSNMRSPQESAGDFIAQIAANRRGLSRLGALIAKTGTEAYLKNLQYLNQYAARLAKNSLSQIADGEYSFEDVLDDDGQGNLDIVIRVTIRFAEGNILVDFTGSAEQVAGNINCPLSVTAAAVYYVFRCLMPAQTPACAGSFQSIKLIAPQHSVVNADFPAAVAAGNVETSTRIVDVVLGALANALPEKIPAASHGSMNNLAMGHVGSEVGDDHSPAWDYYETIGGGMGASAISDGLDAVQTHMTNTLNTPIEALEMKYPLRVLRYQIRQGSAGTGKFNGGNGLIREYEFLSTAQVTLLTERRNHQPWGLAGGGKAAVGVNQFNKTMLSAKQSFKVQAGDVVCITTAGGGGYAQAVRKYSES